MNKKRKSFSSLVSSLLAISLVLNVSALNVDPGPVSDAETGSVQAELVSEITHMRGANERHFQASDGSYVALSYAEQIHYLDEDSGEWVEVDNTLKSHTYTDTQSRVYKNRDGLFDVEFAEPSDTSRDTVTISSEGNVLSWEVYKHITPDSSMGANASAELIRTPILSTAEMVIPEADFSLLTEEEHLTVAKKSASRAMYTDALGNGIDLVYDVSGNKVKESIIIDSYEENASYIAEITADGLTAVLNEDGSVTFTDTEGETVFIVEAPYMFDSGMGSSSDIQVDLVANKTGGYILAYIPDEEWLESQDRVYPVTLDPTVTVYNNRTTPVTYKDDTLYWNGSSMYGTDNSTSILRAGHANGLYYFTLIDYTDLPILPNNCTITGARHVFFISGGTTYPTYLTSYTLSTEYTSGEITVSDIGNGCYSEESGVLASYGSNSAGEDYVVFDYVGDAIGNFANYDPTTGKLYSNGFLVADSRHKDMTDTSYFGQGVFFYSSSSTAMSAANPTQYARPYVRIKYTRNEPPEGVYNLRNAGADLGSGTTLWLFDKVEGVAEPAEEGCYGPYYIRSAYADSAPIYVSHIGGQLGYINLDIDAVHLSPAVGTTSITDDTNADYYWYLRDIGNNRYSIYYNDTTALAVKSNISYVSTSNIYTALELAPVNDSSAKQQWTLTISPTSTSFIWPLAYAEGEGVYVGETTYDINSLWGWRYLDEKDNVSPPRFSHHRGIDIHTRHINGGVIDLKCVADGVIKQVVDSHTYYGKHVVIEHRGMIDGNGFYYTSTYMHLSSEDVTVGQFVKQGQIIGETGSTGNVDAHLHLQIEKTNDTTRYYINPLKRYNIDDDRSDLYENPNPIYLSSHNTQYDNGRVVGVNSDFIFNFDESKYWSDDESYKK